MHLRASRLSHGMAWLFAAAGAVACSSAERSQGFDPTASAELSASAASASSIAPARPVFRRLDGAAPTPLASTLGTADGTCSYKYPANLTSGGGPVLSTVHMVAAYWGSGTDARLQNITSFYDGLSKSEYIGWLSEYGGGRLDYDSTRHVFTPVNKSTSIDDNAVRTEIEAQINNGGLPGPNGDGGTMYVVHFPSSVTVSGACTDFCGYHWVGYHGSTRYQYAVIPDFVNTDCKWGCGGDADWFNNVTSVESHEIVETITDPDGANGYRDRSQCTGENEIGDLCTADQAKIAVGGSTWVVQREWSNKSQSCKAEDFPTDTAFSIDRSGRLNLTALDTANADGWRAPTVLGPSRFVAGAPVTAFHQSPQNVYTALTVDANGAMNLLWDDLTDPSKGWQGPVAYGDPHLQPGGAIAEFQQAATIHAALTIDRNSRMNVTWVDLSTNQGWQGPAAFGDPRQVPGAPIAAFHQTGSVWSALTVDKNGAMNITWLDTTTNQGWHGPFAFGAARFVPGSPIAVFPQSATVWAALAVDKNGQMNVTWLDTTANNGWQGPFAFGDAHLAAGAPVSVFKQSATVWTGLTVDKNGAMNVTWVDLSTNQGWHGPFTFGDAHLSPGAPVATFQQSATVWSALTVDRNGAANVAWLDTSTNQGWHGPSAFGDWHLSPGAPITAFQQSAGVWSGLTIDRNGAMDVAWLDLSTNRGWLGPAAISDNRYPASGAVAVSGVPFD